VWKNRYSTSTNHKVWAAKFTARHPNLVVLEVVVNGGTVRDGDLSFTLDQKISDYTAQHRAEVALDNSLNAIVIHGAQQQRNDAAQQAVPKL